MTKKHYIIPIFVPHEGCPHDCVFCSQFKIATPEENMTAKKAVNIIKEHLATINSQDATVEVSFFGGTFTAIPMQKQRELLEVAKEYKDKALIDYIRLSTRPDYIDRNILDHLKSYGVDIIELGVQSLDEEVLKASGRGHSAEIVQYASELIKSYGFTLGHQIMLGLPSDTPHKDILTAKASISMEPHICRIYPSLVIKSTPMETMYYRGLYKPYSLEETIEVCKKVYALYYAKNINIIRIGLQPTKNINVGGDIVAGPFHPAIRELVEGSMINDMLTGALSHKSGAYELHISKRYVSRLYADKKRYFHKLINNHENIQLRVIMKDSLPQGEINLVNGSEIIKLSLHEYIKELSKSI